jgi:enamine deaminase RidA (YjgF/YER057c/UK114 family)
MRRRLQHAGPWRENAMAKRTRIISPKVQEPPPQRWSNCLRVGDMVFVAGMTARVGDKIEGADEYEQARVIFGKIKDLVEAAGGQVNDVVKVTIFLVDIRNNTKVWKARSEVFSGDFPASTLVEIRALATPDTLVEIEAIAMLGSSSA